LFEQISHARTLFADNSELGKIAHRGRTTIEELQDERILDHIRGLGDFLTSPGERQDLLGVAVAREPLE